MSSTLIYCSCTICKLQIPSSNVSNHYHYKHTGALYPKPPKSNGNCKQCNKIIRGYWVNDKTIFCSSSCAATHRNTNRAMTEDSKQKIRISNIAYDIANNPPKTKVEFCKCKICDKNFVWNAITKGYKKFCSKSCFSSHMSKVTSERLKNPENRKNYGRGKQSYLEKSFQNWLETNNITNFEMESHFYNKQLNKNYYVDFFFRDLNLAIELDGTQHRKTIDADAIRDSYLSDTYGINVIRITHSEYKNKSKLVLVESLLGIT